MHFITLPPFDDWNVHLGKDDLKPIMTLSTARTCTRALVMPDRASLGSLNAAVKQRQSVLQGLGAICSQNSLHTPPFMPHVALPLGPDTDPSSVAGARAGGIVAFVVDAALVNAEAEQVRAYSLFRLVVFLLLTSPPPDLAAPPPRGPRPPRGPARHHPRRPRALRGRPGRHARAARGRLPAPVAPAALAARAAPLPPLAGLGRRRPSTLRPQGARPARRRHPRPQTAAPRRRHRRGGPPRPPLGSRYVTSPLSPR
jgi:hypothetical protein